jgi:hypothetical protein
VGYLHADPSSGLKAHLSFPIIRCFDSFEAVLPSDLMLCNQWQQAGLLADYLENGGMHANNDHLTLVTGSREAEMMESWKY